MPAYHRGEKTKQQLSQQVFPQDLLNIFCLRRFNNIAIFINPIFTIGGNIYLWTIGSMSLKQLII